MSMSVNNFKAVDVFYNDGKNEFVAVNNDGKSISTGIADLGRMKFFVKNSFKVLEKEFSFRKGNRSWCYCVKSEDLLVTVTNCFMNEIVPINEQYSFKVGKSSIIYLKSDVDPWKKQIRPNKGEIEGLQAYGEYVNVRTSKGIIKIDAYTHKVLKYKKNKL